MHRELSDILLDLYRNLRLSLGFLRGSLEILELSWCCVAIIFVESSWDSLTFILEKLLCLL